MMKKVLAMVLCGAIALSLAGCANNEKPESAANQPTSSVTESKDDASSGENDTSSNEEASNEESEPEESSAEEESSEPEAQMENVIDWDSVPYVDEMDLLYVDYNSIYVMYVGDSLDAKCQGGVVIIDYLGTDSVIKIPETIEGKPVVWVCEFISSVPDVSIKLPENIVALGSAITTSTIITLGGFGISGCNNAAVYFPESEITLLYKAFYNCTDLSLIIPSKCSLTINKEAFYSSTMKDNILNLPDNTVYIQELPDDLTAITYRGETYESESSEYKSDWIYKLVDTINLEGANEYIEDDKLIYISANATGTYTVPDGVTQFGNYRYYSCGYSGVFERCLDVTALVLPDSFKSISSNFSFPDQIESITYKGTTYDSSHVAKLIQAINSN